MFGIGHTELVVVAITGLFCFVVPLVVIGVVLVVVLKKRK